VEDFDRIIMVVKNWPDDPHMNYKTNANLKDYIKFEVAPAEENYGFIEEFEYFEKLTMIK
jgi:hypothetical protein